MFEGNPIGILDPLTFIALFYILFYCIGNLVTNFIGKNSCLDSVSNINLKLVLGMAFTSMYLIIFSILGIPIIISGFSLFIVTIIGTICFVIKRYIRERPSKKDLLLNENSIVCLLVLLISIITYFISSSLISGLFGSLADDAAFHTFLLRVVLDNPYGLLGGTVEPYGQFLHTYGMGSYSIGAFTSVIFSIPLYKVIIMFMALLPGLVSLSFYSSVKILTKNSVAGIIACVFSIFLTNGIVIWRSIGYSNFPFLFSIYFCVSSIGFMYLIFFDKSWRISSKIFLFSCILFFSAILYPVAFLFQLILILILIAARVSLRVVKFSFKIETVKYLFSNFTSILRKSSRLSIYANWKKYLSIVFAVAPFFVILPYFFSLNNVFFHSVNSNYPADIMAPNFGDRGLAINNSLKQMIFSTSLPILLSNQFGTTLILAFFAIIIIPMLLIWKGHLKNKEPNESILKSSLLPIGLMGALLIYILYLSDFRIPFIPITLVAYMFLPTQRVFFYLIIPSIILSSIAIYLILSSIQFVSIKPGKILLKRIKSPKIPLSMAIIIIFLGSFLFTGFGEFQSQLRSVSDDLNKYSVLTNEDLMLMQWIITNTPPHSVILVSNGDAGQYISSITQRQAVYEYSLRRFSTKYETLLQNLNQNPSDPSVIEALNSYNITYIFVGSKILTYAPGEISRETINAATLLNFPYFTLEKKIGDSQLIRFNYTMAIEQTQERERILNSLHKGFFYDTRYPTSWVQNLTNVVDFLNSKSFEQLNADQLKNWIINSIENGTAQKSILVMTMGIAPDTIAENLSASCTINAYLNAGGRVVWIGDIPFFYIGHNDSTFTPWYNQGGTTILGVKTDVSSSFLNFKELITPAGVDWGLAVEGSIARPVESQNVTIVLSNAPNPDFAASWIKLFNSTSFKEPGEFIRVFANKFNGSNENCLKTLFNVASYIPSYKNWAVG